MAEENKTKKNEAEIEEEQNKKEPLPDIKPGMVVRVYEKFTDTDAKGNPKERVQVFKGIVLSHHGGKEAGATITVRKIAIGGIGVEKIFPIYSPSIKKIEVVKRHKVNRAKLYYLRDYKKKLKEIKE